MDRFTGGCLCGNLRLWRRDDHTESGLCIVSTAASITGPFFNASAISLRIL